jgi:hypothetical protein
MITATQLCVCNRSLSVRSIADIWLSIWAAMLAETMGRGKQYVTPRVIRHVSWAFRHWHLSTILIPLILFILQKMRISLPFLAPRTIEQNSRSRYPKFYSARQSAQRLYVRLGIIQD